MGDYAGAVSDYTLAIQLDAKYTRAYLNRGKSHLQLGNKESGCADLEKAEKLGLVDG
jgi:tetratricopeptide (TPR) repeat protein